MIDAVPCRMSAFASLLAIPMESIDGPFERQLKQVRTDSVVEKWIVALKREYPSWGAPKIRER